MDETPAPRIPEPAAETLFADPAAALIRRLCDAELAQAVFGDGDSFGAEEVARVVADESVRRAAQTLLEEVGRARRGETSSVELYVFPSFDIEIPSIEIQPVALEEAMPIDAGETPPPPDSAPPTAPSLSQTDAPMPPQNPPDPYGARPGAVPINRAPGTPQPVKARFGIDRNAKAGEAFEAFVEADAALPVEILDIAFPEGLGLSYEADARRIAGVPALAGEHVLKIGYRRSDPASGSARQEGECVLIVNPDPRSLWKDLPSDSADQDWKPDEARECLAGEDGTRLLAASRRGRSHAHVGGFREDDFFLRTHEGWHILAVADGAGSAERSRRGSALAARRAGARLAESLSGEAGQTLLAAAERADESAAKASLYGLLGGAALAAMKAIDEEAKLRGKPVKDYATTLILGLHRAIPAGHLFAAYWVGDGAAAVYRQGQEVVLLGESDAGEFAGQTRFLDYAALASGEEIMKRLRFAILPDFTAFALMSDGVSDPKFESDGNLTNPQRWAALWDELSPLLDGPEPDAGLLDWLNFWSVGNHDDRTLALLYPARAADSRPTDVSVSD